MTFSMRKLTLGLLVFGLGGIPLAAQASRTPMPGAEVRMDYSSARREIQGFEDALDNVISATFSGAPFALDQQSKGAYLQGYGMTFSYGVNIHRALINTPFGPKRGDPITPEEKKKRIEELKENLIRTLFMRGDGLRQLPRDEAVSIVGFIVDRNFPDEESQNKTVILTVSRKDLDEFARKEDRFREFKQRVKSIEY